ncbi:ABC transporter-like [Syntrophomonas zehnderi OL-4]|uniref:ABC transporter-like n=1 Tax=Syntrophomonas zehnderi OL-4 TaxID=690567 RepID=A0A0E4GDJ4_9FIRM|nr:ATP-binding cassette domain-containing protein [Syntrophomonas zehnderi]CFY10843.1 ABC transporter-like [Syntrophomonas zehnderi OL-4]
MLTVKNLSKSYGRKKVLHSIDLEFDNHVYGLLGANGAGKTTLIRCMTGLYEPQQGEILYHSQPIKKSPAFLHDLGYLPQAFGMFQELTLYEMMEYICCLKKIDKSQCNNEIEHALSSVNLEDKIHERIKTLSGGMVRRAGIAQAILGFSKVIFLDEPTAGLDPGERARFKNTINTIKNDRMILISTHIVEDVDACCQNVIVIEEGRVLFQGTCEQLKQAATQKVYQIKAEDSDNIIGEKFILKVSEVEGEIYHRVLAQGKQNYPYEKNPTLEDGYMCLVKGIA